MLLLYYNDYYRDCDVAVVVDDESTTMMFVARIIAISTVASTSLE